MPGDQAIYEDGQDLYPTSTEEHTRILRDVLDAFDSAKLHRQPLETRWKRFYKLYRSYVTRKQGDWHSKVFIPIVFYVVETIVPKLVAQLPKFLAYPVGPEDVEPAKQMEELLEWSADQSKLYIELVSAYRSALKYGTGILKTFHDVRTRTRTTQQPVMEAQQVPPMPQPVIDPETGQPMAGPDGQPVIQMVDQPPGPEIDTGRTQSVTEDVTLYDGPAAEAIDIFNVFPAPEATSIEDARFIVHRSFRDDSYVRDMLDQQIYRLPPEREFDELWSNEQEPHMQRQSEIGLGSATDPTRKSAELLEYWTDTHVITVLNRIAVVRVQANPFEHGEKPFVRILDHFQEHEFWGVGEIEALEGLQDLENAIWNQRVDNVRLAMNRIFAVQTDKLEDLRDLQLKPGSTIRIQGNAAIDEVLMPIPMEDVTGSSYTEAAEVERMSEKVSGVSAYQTGTDSPTLNDTATGVALISEQGNSRFALKVRMAELTGLAPLARHFGSILQQFFPAQMAIRRQGPKGAWEWSQVTQDGIRGALDFDIEAESSTVTESLRKEQAMGLLNTLANLIDPTTGMPIVNLNALVEDVLTVFGKKDLDRYLTPQMAPQMGPPGMGMDPSMGLPDGFVPPGSYPPTDPAQQQQLPPPGPPPEGVAA